MKVICAWCNREIGVEDGPDEVRYTVCKACLAKFFPDRKNESEGRPNSRLSED